MKDLGLIIEELIEYGKVHLGLLKLDAIYARNALLKLLDVSHPFDGEIDNEFIKNLEDIFEIEQFKDFKIYKEGKNLVCMADDKVKIDRKYFSDKYNIVIEPDSDDFEALALIIALDTSLIAPSCPFTLFFIFSSK